MNDIDTLIQEFNARLAVMRDSLDGAPLEHAVEIGTALSAMIKAAEGIQSTIKETLRDAAVLQLQQQPGSVTLEGTGTGRVTVTVPRPKLRLTKAADIDLLQKVLGDQFDLYLETMTSYKPRDVAGDLIAAMEDGPAKTVMLSAVEQFEGTPRVSFK